MLIKKVNLKNYGAIKSAKFDFQAGWNLINGANGNGKSHIIRAIAYALLNKTFGKIEDDLNWDSNEFLISLEALYQNINFNIQCSFGNKSGTSKECKIGDKNFTTNTEVTEALKKYFDPTLCSASILSFQGQMDIVTAKDAERREMLKKIYDIDFTNQVLKLEDEKQQYEDEKTQYEKEIYALKNKSYDIQDFIELPMTEDEFKVTQLKIKDIENQIASYENFKKEIERVEKELDFVTENHASIENALKELQGKLTAKTKELEKQNKNLEELELEDSIQELDDLLVTLEKREIVNALKTELNSIELKRIPTFDEGNYESKKELLSNKKYELKQNEDMLSLIEQGKCPTCGNEFTEGDKSDYEKAINELTLEITELTKEVNTLSEKKNEIEQKLKEQESLKNRQDHLSSKIQLEEEKVLSKIDDIKNKKDDLFSKEKFYSENIKALQKEGNVLGEEIIKKENEVEKSEIKVLSKKQELEKLQSEDILDVDRLEQTKESLLTSVESFNYAKTQNDIIKKNNEEIEQQKNKDSRKLNIVQDKSDTLEKELRQYEEAIKVYKKELPKYIISYLLEDLKDGMNDLLNEAYEGRYQVEMQETNTGLKILYGSKKKDISLSSGAEQNLFNLGFKNAFSYLSGLQILFLDESLNFADDNIARQTFNHLNLKLEKGDLEQIFVITHKPKIKELLEADYGAKVFTVEDGNVRVGEI